MLLTAQPEHGHELELALDPTIVALWEEDWRHELPPDPLWLELSLDDPMLDPSWEELLQVPSWD